MATELLDAPVVAPEPHDAPPGRPWWERLDFWAGLLVVAACCAFVFFELEPSLLFRNTTPSGGDTAAHVWWPAYLRDHLLPWRLAGWAPSFYAGFPAGQFYFPLPALLIVALDIVLPYNVAFKLVTAMGPILLPVGAYIFGRGLRAPRPVPAAFAVAMVAFLFFNGDPVNESVAFNQHIMGGNLASTLAGEFSYTMALAFALAFFGALAWSLRTGERLWIPALLLAAVVTSHLVVAIFAAVGGVVIWLASRPFLSAWRAAAIVSVGGLLTAIWTLPLVATLKYTTDMRYGAIACPATGECTPGSDPSRYLFPKFLWGVEGVLPWQWGATVLVAIALIGAVVGRRRSTLVVVTIVAISGLLFRLWETIQTTTVWNLRLLPFWYVSLFLLMAIGVAETIRGVAWLVRRFAEREEVTTPLGLVQRSVLAGLTVVIALGALIGIDHNKDFLPYWVRWNYRGYEDTAGSGYTPAKSYNEYRTVVDSFGALPPGRLLWEGNSQLNVYGSPLALMLLPYWTDERISSMEGLYYEASATTPYHFMLAATLAAPGNASNAVRGVPYREFSQFSSWGVPRLQAMGVRYLAVHSAQSKSAADADSRLRLVATVPDLDGQPPNGWSVYRVAHSQLVTPLRNEPVVVDDLSDAARDACRRRLEREGIPRNELQLHVWQDCIAAPWFDDPDAIDRPLVAEGPSSWKRDGPAAARSTSTPALPHVRVTHIHQGDDSISFHVSRTGVPVYVKVSYFPNWEADGAHGPYRATPNFMVVVPTSHDVTLRYGSTDEEWVGRLGTLAGIAGLVVLIAWPRLRRRRLGSTSAIEEDGVYDDPPAPAR